MKTATQIDEILKEIESRLEARRRAGGMDLRVTPQGYTQDEDWFTVIVTPAASGVRAYDYVEALSEMENDLKSAGIDHVLLVPAIAD